jgi:hypothetical protein
VSGRLHAPEEEPLSPIEFEAEWASEWLLPFLEIGTIYLVIQSLVSSLFWLNYTVSLCVVCKEMLPFSSQVFEGYIM